MTEIRCLRSRGDRLAPAGVRYTRESASLRAAGARQVGARSAGVNVCCEELAPLAVPVERGSRAAIFSERNSYSILAPACALWPSATATCEPIVQASGCRAQKPRMSETAAEAAETA